MPASTTRGAFPYPVAADAPPAVHLDIKALADQSAAVVALYQQGTNAARLAAGHVAGTHWRETDTDQVYYDNGTTWQPVSRRIVRRTTGSGFPTSPVDGDRTSFAVAEGSQLAATVDWEFAYYAALGDAYKWQFTGGADLPMLVEATSTFAADGAGIDSTSSPTITLPFAGYYDVTFGGLLQTPSAANPIAVLYLLLGGAAWANLTLQQVGTGAFTLHMQDRSAVLCTAGQVLSIGSQCNGGGNYTIAHRWLRARPIRVSP